MFGITDFKEIIVDYGYFAVFLFASIEGEFAIFTAGILASHGLLDLHKVILFAFLGTTLSEQIGFHIGYRFGRSVIDKLPIPITNNMIDKILYWIQKYDAMFILLCRFVYGIRMISPILIGVAKINPRRFTFLNMIAAGLWACVVPSVGYYMSDLISEFIGPFSDHPYIYTIIFVLFIICFSYIVKKLTTVKSSE